MPGPAQTIRQTPQEYAQLVGAFSERLHTDADFAHLMMTVCGGPERLEAFTCLSGVGISRFAALLDLPASTVRHYQRLGLVTPYAINGKFRFWIHNLIQVESILQWRNLGLSLEDICSQRGRERLGGQSLTFNALTAEGLSALVTGKAVRINVPELLGNHQSINSLRSGAFWLPLQEERVRVSFNEVFRGESIEAKEEALDSMRVLEEIRTARKRLEEQLHLLQARVDQARRLEAALEQTQ